MDGNIVGSTSSCTLNQVNGDNPTTASISVVWIGLDQPSETVHNLARILSTEEEHRVARYATTLLRQRATVRFARRRQIAASLFDVAPEDLISIRDITGRPRFLLSSGDFVDVNSSHCGGVALVAMSTSRRLGVDVEAAPELSPIDKLASWIENERDHEQVREMASNERVDAYLRIWTRKEAYLKATGEGIGAGVKHVNVPRSLRPWGVRFRPLDRGPDWLFYDLDPPPTGLAAALVVAVENEDAPVPTVHVSSFQDSVRDSIALAGGDTPTPTAERGHPKRR
jgi:4'-phosphopantetheinyl transferase